MTHAFPVTVYYEDTDMGGIVYHANYLKFIERARSDWVRARGIDQNALRDGGLVFAVRRIEAEFLAPARLDDRLDVQTELNSASGARITLHQSVQLEASPLFRATVELAAIDIASGRPVRLPKELRG
ncbi:tol-pal system-associated acyl-CoA thioesterase [Maribius pontilimi]|uniref:Tol-pal system-associated acyl-CoA thioesterase n=1 Tax=Palleronia pontilimi TaxID=1964209 RepID=A0A934MB95_9RHOB|nr:tol-pal system-associated acyl-CoA thioesterase [Palleronia pontilimi]MBJ3761280.1 tol-pal system-associated acyl-CoA thioesterase [Palleronia pontilimi]